MWKNCTRFVGKKNGEHGMIEKRDQMLKYCRLLGVCIPQKTVHVEHIHTQPIIYANKVCFLCFLKLRILRAERASRKWVPLGSRVTGRCSLWVTALRKAQADTAPLVPLHRHMVADGEGGGGVQRGTTTLFPF